MDVKSELYYCGNWIVQCEELNSSIMWSLSIIVLGMYGGDEIRDVLVFYWWIDYIDGQYGYSCHNIKAKIGDGAGGGFLSS